MATVKLNKRVTEKIRELNSSGAFATELRLGGVARQLAQLPLDSSLEILEGLLEAEEAHNDPTTFVVAAASALLNPPEEPEEPAEETPEDAAEEEAGETWEAEGLEQTAQEEAAEDWGEGAGDEVAQEEDDEAFVPQLSTTVHQKILSLNKSGKLCSAIDLDKVGNNMRRLSEPIALQLLKDIEANADMVDKPNNLIADASRKIFESGHGDVSKKIAEQIGSLMRRIRWVNQNISLAFPLHMGHALSVLQDIQHQDALQVLKSLVEQAEQIESPQSFLRREARKMEEKRQGKGKAKGKSAKGKTGSGKNGSSKNGHGTTGYSNGKSGHGKGSSESNGARNGSWQSTDKPGSKGAKGGAKGGKGKLTASELKVARTVGFINKHAGLATNFTYEQAKRHLDMVDEKTQLKVLEKLKQEASAVEDPLGWVRSACSKFAALHRKKYARRQRNRSPAKGGKGGKGPPAKRQKTEAQEAWEETEIAAEGDEEEDEEFDWSQINVEDGVAEGGGEEEDLFAWDEP